MLDLQNILWVVPGVVFIYFYNRIRPAGSISVSGWPYLFLLVIVAIIPFKSGYRDEKTKEVVWNTYYPEYKNKSHLVDMETIIPRSEIINFGKFSKETFKHFEKQHS